MIHHCAINVPTASRLDTPLTNAKIRLHLYVPRILVIRKVVRKVKAKERKTRSVSSSEGRRAQRQIHRTYGGWTGPGIRNGAGPRN